MKRSNFTSIRFLISITLLVVLSCKGQHPIIVDEEEPDKDNQAGVEIPIEIPLPILAELPVIPEDVYYVTDFGAHPHDEIDDTEVIQQAINTVSANGGGRIIFPDGVYMISVLQEATLQASNELIVLSAMIALGAENSRKATIRLADNQPSYGTIFRWKQNGNADDIRIKGLVIDANGVNNKPKTYDDFQFIHEGRLVRWLPRFVLGARNGKRMHITDVHFTNLLNINTVNIGVALGSIGEQVEQLSDVTIDNCLFDNVGWQEYDFDHSTIFTRSSRFAITNNTFTSLNGAGTLSARCAIEIHGNDQIVKNNDVTGFAIGINVTGTGVLSHRQLIENNKFLNVARGIYLWSAANAAWANETTLKDIIIRKNQIRIAPDAWLMSRVPSKTHIAGISTNPGNTSPIENLLIEENTITTVGYSNYSGSYSVKPVDCGIAFNNTPLKDVCIINNHIERTLGPSIGGNADIANLFVHKNKLFEPELASLSQSNERAAILFTGEIKNATIIHNNIKDVELPNNIQYGIIMNCDGNCIVEDNMIVPPSIPLQLN